MHTPRHILSAVLLLWVAVSCVWDRQGSEGETAHVQLDSGAVIATTGHGLGSSLHAQAVMKSSYCADCHPAIYAEHEANTHGRAFTDEEVRLATGRFSQGDCINCHTPRPIFETGIGQNPLRRHHGLLEGNTCMTCHWAEDEDYSRFEGGSDCLTSFDDRVGKVEACATCHRNHGTPYQWELSPKGKLAGRDCIDCHMPIRHRPVAVGEEPRDVYSHDFSGGRTATQLHKAYGYTAKIEGNVVVVRITNRGTGHNFPTELKQRSVESVVVIRDTSGVEVGRSRMVFRDPYKRPYGLTLPVNTQIPSGESREHRVPINVGDGSVECELHYKLYYPIEDYHPGLARRLESETLLFSELDPSEEEVISAPDVRVVTPEGISAEEAGPANLVDFARPPIGQVELEIPTGVGPADIDALIALFQFPVPEAAARARARLAEIGAPAIPALVTAMGSWDNKTWKQAMSALEAIGAPAIPALIIALDSPELYVRLHSCELLPRIQLGDEKAKCVERLRSSLSRPNALDRAYAADTLGQLGASDAAEELVALVRHDSDPDVVRGASLALLALDHRAATPALREALQRFEWEETKRDIGYCLAGLGDPAGVPVLLAGLDHPDDLIRESFFEAFFDVTGMHKCYDPMGPRSERLADIASLQGWWSRYGGESVLRPVRHVTPSVKREVRKIIGAIGGGDVTVAPGDDPAMRARLLELDVDAVEGIVSVGLKYPPGFSNKRALLCGVLGEIGHPDAVPALIAVLRDPVISVAAWACDSLGAIGDDSALPAMQRYHQRLLSLASRGAIPESAGTPQALIAMAAGHCYYFGDELVESDLIAFLLSDDEAARQTAYGHLKRRYGSALELDLDGGVNEWRRAVERWQAGRR